MGSILSCNSGEKHTRSCRTKDDDSSEVRAKHSESIFLKEPEVLRALGSGGSSQNLRRKDCPQPCIELEAESSAAASTTDSEGDEDPEDSACVTVTVVEVLSYKFPPALRAIRTRAPKVTHARCTSHVGEGQGSVCSSDLPSPPGDEMPFRWADAESEEEDSLTLRRFLFKMVSKGGSFLPFKKKWEDQLALLSEQAESSHDEKVRDAAQAALLALNGLKIKAQFDKLEIRFFDTSSNQHALLFTFNPLRQSQWMSISSKDASKSVCREFVDLKIDTGSELGTYIIVGPFGPIIIGKLAEMCWGWDERDLLKRILKAMPRGTVTGTAVTTPAAGPSVLHPQALTVPQRPPLVLSPIPEQAASPSATSMAPAVGASLRASTLTQPCKKPPPNPNSHFQLWFCEEEQDPSNGLIRLPADTDMARKLLQKHIELVMKGSKSDSGFQDGIELVGIWPRNCSPDERQPIFVAARAPALCSFCSCSP